MARSGGRPLTSVLAAGLAVVWGGGPIFGFNDIWQLVIDTGTTIITFPVVFPIRNTQDRDIDALRLEIDELLRVTQGARLALLNMEELGSERLEKVKADFVGLGRRNKHELDDPER